MKLALLVFLFLFQPAYADDALSDPAAEMRAQNLGDEIRCVVCQSESINASQAEMARDMRLLVRDKISQGWTDQQVLDFLRVRYGDFILLKPPVQKNTALLWFLPILFLGGGLGLSLALFRKSSKV